MDMLTSWMLWAEKQTIFFSAYFSSSFLPLPFFFFFFLFLLSPLSPSLFSASLSPQPRCRLARGPFFYDRPAVVVVVVVVGRVGAIRALHVADVGKQMWLPLGPEENLKKTIRKP